MKYLKPLILFDMDGTLIDLERKPKYTGLDNQHKPYLSLKDQMKKIAAEKGVPEEVYTDLNRMATIWNAVRGYAEEHFPERVDNLMKSINQPFMAHEKDDHNRSFLMPDTIPGLQTLKDEGYEMSLVTTASRWSYDRISSSEEYGKFGVFFKYSLTRDEVGYIKPHPEPLLKMLGNYGCETAVYVGDSDHDGYAAEAAGCKFVLINTRGYDPDTVATLNADAVIENLSQLPGVLETL